MKNDILVKVVAPSKKRSIRKTPKTQGSQFLTSVFLPGKEFIITVKLSSLICYVIAYSRKKNYLAIFWWIHHIEVF